MRREEEAGFHISPGPPPNPKTPPTREDTTEWIDGDSPKPASYTHSRLANGASKVGGTRDESVENIDTALISKDISDTSFNSSVAMPGEKLDELITAKRKVVLATEKLFRTGTNVTERPTEVQRVTTPSQVLEQQEYLASLHEGLVSNGSTIVAPKTTVDVDGDSEIDLPVFVVLPQALPTIQLKTTISSTSNTLNRKKSMSKAPTNRRNSTKSPVPKSQQTDKLSTSTGEVTESQQPMQEPETTSQPPSKDQNVFWIWPKPPQASELYTASTSLASSLSTWVWS